MANPILPFWEYIPDGEPRVFGDRVYLYGSHDRVGSDSFCDYKLKIWSASINDLNHWTCHGDSFHTRNDHDHVADTNWTNAELYAPDVVFKDGKYYLYAYILGSKGCVGISEYPEGPFQLLSTYKCEDVNIGDGGIFNDPGVLVDDDGKVYIYYGFQESHMNEISTNDMTEIVKDSYIPDVIQSGQEENDFFEACSPRKIMGKYYLIYSPQKGNRLAYAIADRPTGPFVRKGYIIDNGIDYPAGNNHGSICCINGQWYVFYHRMTNGTLTSRRACVEKITILPDGTIPQVEMTSLGFEDSLNPYNITQAEVACFLKGSGFITELDSYTRPITEIKNNTIIGYKYFDFGIDNSSSTYEFSVRILGTGCCSKMHILIDDDIKGEEIGCCEIGEHDGEYTARVNKITGRHSLYFKIESNYSGRFKEVFEERNLFNLVSFIFKK